MNRLVVLSLAVLLAPGGAGGGLSAQQRDSMQQRGDTAEAQRLRAQIEERFSARVQHDLKLTQDQTTKLRASQERFSARRRQVMQQQMQRHRDGWFSAHETLRIKLQLPLRACWHGLWLLRIAHNAAGIIHGS